MARVSFASANVNTGVPFSETAMEKALAAFPGGLSFCFLPAADGATAAKSWSPLEAGRRIIRDRVNPARTFAAPSAATSPTLVTGAAGSRAVLRATAASTHNMLTNAPDSIKFTTTQGSILFIFGYRGTASSFITGSTLLGATDLVPNFNVTTSGATQYVRLLKGDVTVRVQETTQTDLDSDNNMTTVQYHAMLWTYDATRGFELWIDGVKKPLNETDLGCFTNGAFQLFKRGGAYGDVDLVGLAHAPLNIATTEYDSYRGQMFSSIISECGIVV